MFILTYALQGIALGLSAAASPGPFQAYLISQALRLGWRRALPVAFAPLISDGPMIAIVLLVLTRFPEEFLRWLQIGGSIFILYLAWKSLQAYQSFQSGKQETGAERQSLMQAVLVNFTSPSPYIFWSILAGPLLIAAWKAHPANGIAFLVSFYSVMVLVLGLLVVVFGSASRLGPRVNRAMLGLSSLVMFGFGIYQLWQGIFVGISLM